MIKDIWNQQQRDHESLPVNMSIWAQLNHVPAVQEAEKSSLRWKIDGNLF